MEHILKKRKIKSPTQDEPNLKLTRVLNWLHEIKQSIFFDVWEISVE